MVIQTYQYPSQDVDNYLQRKNLDDHKVSLQVAEILSRVRQEGLTALFEFTERFDGVSLNEDSLIVSKKEITEAYQEVEPKVLEAMGKAAENIRSFHRKQLRNSWMEPDGDGNLLGQLIRPVDRVGIYVPGGTAPLFSSVLMNAIPAVVAGVEQIVMATPPGKDGRINPYTLVAAKEAGVSQVFRMGGAQAVAAMAFGVGMEAVDLIVGPGNIYVTLAKKQVYGTVSIDMLAGPSEILVIADDSADPAYVAADFLSQAEHDERARVVLVTTCQDLMTRVSSEVEKQMAAMPRREIMAKALAQNGAFILVQDLDEACRVSNQIAPEHLEVLTREPFALLGKLKHAGAIFLGPYSPEPVGDYYAGPNHVLPTGGTPKFFSPLNVDIFQKKSNLIAYSQQGFLKAAPDILAMARVEGLEAHANAIAVRIKEQ